MWERSSRCRSHGPFGKGSKPCKTKTSWPSSKCADGGAAVLKLVVVIGFSERNVGHEAVRTGVCKRTALWLVGCKRNPLKREGECAVSDKPVKTERHRWISEPHPPALTFVAVLRSTRTSGRR